MESLAELEYKYHAARLRWISLPTGTVEKMRAFYRLEAAMAARDAYLRRTRAARLKS